MMWKPTKKMLIPLIGILVIFIAVGLFLYNKPHQNITKAKAAYSISSSELFSQFEQSTPDALKKYTGKVLEVNGSVQTIEISESYATVILADEGDFYGVNCSFNEDQMEGLDALVVGELITLKGECKGFIDDVIISNCVIIKKQL